MEIQKVKIEDLNLEPNVQAKKAIKAYAATKKVQRDLEFQKKMASIDKKAQQFRENVKKVKLDNTRLSNKPNKRR